MSIIERLIILSIRNVVLVLENNLRIFKSKYVILS